MDNQITSLGQLAQALTGGCGYEEKDFDPNLIEALDKLGEQFGPMGVALAAATRTEPDNLGAQLHEMFAHQREELWSWLRTERYTAIADGPDAWEVIDTERTYGDEDRIVAEISMEDGEDAARALADHLNRKITLAKVAQATADTSAVKATES